MLRSTPLWWPLLALGFGLAVPWHFSPYITGSMILGATLGILLSQSLLIRWICLILFFFASGLFRQPIPPSPPAVAPTLLITCTHYPEETAKSWRVKGDIQARYSPDSGWISSGGKILVYLDKRTSFSLEPGRSYVIQGRPQRISPPARETDFDFRTYMIRQEIFHQIWVASHQIWPLSNPPQSSLRLWLLARARKVGQIYREYIAHPEAADVTEAMITGRRDHLSDELNQHYTAAGAVHILAVSGMHISLVYGLLTLLFRGQVWIWPKAWVKPKFLLSVVVLTLYAGFTGMSASVMRATVMFYLLILGQWFQRHVSSENILYGTSLVLLYMEPTWLYDIGFQLSFLAVWGILTFYPRCRSWWKPDNPGIQWVWDLTALGLAAQLFTFPISLYYFHQFPTYFYVTNVVTALLASALVPLGLALWFFSATPLRVITQGLGYLTSWCAQGLNFLNGEIAHLPYSVVRGFYLEAWEVGVWYGMLCLVLWGEKLIPLKWILWGCMGGLSVLWMQGIRKDWQQEQVYRMEEWELSRQRVWIKIQGKYAVCISKQPLSAASKQYALANYWAKEGVREVVYWSLESTSGLEGKK